MTRRKSKPKSSPPPTVKYAAPKLPEQPLVPPELARAGPPPTPSPEPVGVQCSRCHCRHAYVRFTWPVVGGATRRRRECRNCGHTWITTERNGG